MTNPTQKSAGRDPAAPLSWRTDRPGVLPDGGHDAQDMASPSESTRPGRRATGSRRTFEDGSVTLRCSRIDCPRSPCRTAGTRPASGCHVLVQSQGLADAETSSADAPGPAISEAGPRNEKDDQERDQGHISRIGMR